MALIFYFINLVLQFFSRKIFLDYLGADVLGLNTTATNLLQFLNLAEMGIGTAVGFSLYKPFHDNDTRAISEIVSLQGKLYRRIAYVVIAAAGVLMCFFPKIFAKMELPLWYAYASFGVLLFSAMLSYFVNYRQVLLSASQQHYKIHYSYKASILAKVLVQILAIKYLDNGYVWWLVLEAAFAVIAAAALNRTVRHTYPDIKESPLSFKELNAKHPELKTKIGQTFFHQFGGFVLTQTTPFIIYAYASLALVSYYGNYMLIIHGMMLFAAAITNGIIAGIGNLIVESSMEKVLSVFEELFSVRFWIAAVMCFGFYTLAQPFITLWIGSEYLLPQSTLALLTAMLYIMIFRYVVDSFLYAYGFFSDIWAPVTEAALNIGLSILFGSLWGLNGILAGVLVSLVAIGVVWKPFFLFRIKLKQGLGRYLVVYAQHLAAGAGAAVTTVVIMRHFPVNPGSGFGNLVIYAMANCALFGLLLFAVSILSGFGLKRFVRRFVSKKWLTK